MKCQNQITQPTKGIKQKIDTDTNISFSFCTDNKIKFDPVIEINYVRYAKVLNFC